MTIMKFFKEAGEDLVKGFADVFGFNKGPDIPKSKTIEEIRAEMAEQKEEIAAKNTAKHKKFSNFKAVKQAKRRVI